MFSRGKEVPNFAMSDTEATQDKLEEKQTRERNAEPPTWQPGESKDKDRLNDARTMKEAGQRQVKQMELSG